jgi:Icc-related predicted phosphoesterase
MVKTDVLWVIKRGALTSTSYNLFLAEDKIVGVKLCSHKGPITSTFAWKSTTKATIAGGLLGAIAVENQRATFEKATEIAKLPLEDALKTAEESFTINNSDIFKIKLRRKGLLKNMVELEIEAKNEKYKWEVMGVPGNNDAKYKDVEEILKSKFDEKILEIHH